jgi:hypothetical protein
MTTRRATLAGAIVGVLGAVAGPAAAQPLGTFSWQLQPYCNRVTFTVTQNGAVFTLDGFDDRCGATARAAAAGVAVLNPNGSVSLGFTVVAPDGALLVDATINPSTLGGTWRDDRLDGGSFVFNASAPGDPRPGPNDLGKWSSGFHARALNGAGYFTGTRFNGTADVPTAVTTGDSLARLGGGGFNGTYMQWPTGMIGIVAGESWTPSSNATRLYFSTTNTAEINATTRMVVDADGSVGIGNGEARAMDRLDVNGDIRVGTSGTNGCLKNNGGGNITGVCSSDARLKREVAGVGDVLSNLAALRPVTFSWRADEYPERGFGGERQLGLIAQEVEQVLPELVTTDDAGFKAVDYGRLPLLAIQAIRELKEKHDALEQRLRALEATVR